MHQHIFTTDTVYTRTLPWQKSAKFRRNERKQNYVKHFLTQGFSYTNLYFTLFNDSYAVRVNTAKN